MKCVIFTYSIILLLKKYKDYKGKLFMKKKKEAYYVHVYTLRDKSTKSIKIEPWRSLKEEMNVLGLKDSDIFQIQMVWYDPNKEDKKK
ncbi:conserved hypothetical protein (plasmid) [Bacillus cereus AH820]|uniref:Uncharacterized protein n=4 Tax=Bacillus cereus group TaxID=86661 RepID=A1BZD0_BACCE|nr:hypothetical protein pPER272_AH820_0100 [Bacillus cereus]ABK01274.1 hypothetical protein pPER272_0100 [Bacillus cereus]ACK92951.1 conserved hypothetical protein [Bacillus cereus AH820]SME27672.1 hypothetical protein BACERE00221_03623 [Bacillus paranthracis]